MKTRCPHCNAINDIPNHYADKKIKCPSCTKTFTAACYLEEIVKKTPNNPPRKEKERIGWPGMACQIFGVLCLIYGFVSIEINAMAYSASDRTDWGFGRGLLACMFFIALGMIINRLERIAHHLEHHRREHPSCLKSLD